MRWPLLLLVVSVGLACSPGDAFAGPKVDQQQVDKEEILRRGDWVEHITPGEAGVDIDNPTAPPADDKHKWHVTLYLAKGDPDSQALVRDWKSHPKLAAFGSIDEPSRSWSHMHVMYQGDLMTKWKWSAVDASKTPVIWVQPPITGEWGDPGTIVAQYPYAGDPEAAAEFLSKSLNLYGKTIGDARRERFRAAAAAEGEKPGDHYLCAAHGVEQCPFCPTPGPNPAPAVDPYQPLPMPYGPSPLQQYPPESAFGGGLAELFAPVLSALKGLIPWVINLIFFGGVGFGGYKLYQSVKAGQANQAAAVRVQAAEPLKPLQEGVLMQAAEFERYEDPERKETNRVLGELAAAVAKLAEKKE